MFNKEWCEFRSTQHKNPSSHQCCKSCSTKCRCPWRCFSTCINYGRKFATKVLSGMKAGDESKLFERNVRYDSLLAADWPQKLQQFILQPENSRSVPGKDAISVRYHHPKCFLLHSKLNIAIKFKEAFPECNFSTSTLTREFPPYTIQPISQDIGRNTCTIQANARRLIKAINKIL